VTAPAPRVLDPGGFRVPSLSYRILAGGTRLVPYLVLLVGLPDAVLAYLDAHGVTLPISILTVTVAGVLISVLSTAAYVLRPSRAYGPLSAATSVVSLAYLFVIWLQATYRIAVPNASVSISIEYARLIELVLLVPALALIASLVTTVEDLRSPSERLPFDFPA
jgi:hypothetical protein